MVFSLLLETAKDHAEKVSTVLGLETELGIYCTLNPGPLGKALIASHSPYVC